MARSIVIYVWTLSMLFGMLGYTASLGRVDSTSKPISRILAEDGVLSDRTIWFFCSADCPCTRVSMEVFQSLLKSELDGDASSRWSVKLVEVVRRGETRARYFPMGVTHRGLAVERVRDDGSLAERMGVRKSGHLLIIGSAGRLLFQGGITPARGHQGSCNGLVRARLALRTDAVSGDAPVFGCCLPIGSVERENSWTKPEEGVRE